jgi:DNA polymerase delta subunit 1
MSPIKRSLPEGDALEGALSRQRSDRQPPKRLRGGGNDDDEQLFLDDDDDDEMPEQIPPEAADDDDVVQALKASLPAAQRWQRPPVRSDLDNRAALNLQWIDMDVVSGAPLPSVNELEPHKKVGSQVGQVPVLRTYGVTEEGHSTCVFLHGFTPYACFAVPPECTVDPSQVSAMRLALDNALQGARKDGRVLAVEHLREHRSIMGYQAPHTDFLKVYVNLPHFVPGLKRVMEEGLKLPGIVQELDNNHDTHYSFAPYECNVPFVLRFMVDQGLGGAGWLTLPARTYQVRQAARKETHCQLEVDIIYDDIIVRKSEGKWNKVAPLRILSFDIECEGRKGHFPEAEKDPVIQIANCLTVYGQEKPIVQNVFTLKGCLPIVGAQVITSDEEDELLMKWRAFLEAADPDIITGYNVQNFDIPYLLDRATTLSKKSSKLGRFANWGRIQGVPCKMRDTTFQSAAFGKRNNVETTIDGRVIFDMYPYMQRNHKLSSYSLNSVCAEYLGQQKEDVSGTVNRKEYQCNGKAAAVMTHSFFQSLHFRFTTALSPIYSKAVTKIATDWRSTA